MSNAEFPARTAGEVTLPNGDVVFICTLNTLLREEADNKARWHAQAACRCYLKGEADYPELLAKVRSMSAEEQSQFLAQQEYYTIHRETEEKYPLPDQPEQGDDKPEEFAKAAQKWEADCKKVEEKRKKAEETRYEAELKKNRALTNSVRVDRCCTAYYAQEWAKAFVQRSGIETMYRAVRLSDDHTLRYFKSAAAFEDADDEVQKACTEFYYQSLETVKAEDVPILPAAS